MAEMETRGKYGVPQNADLSRSEKSLKPLFDDNRSCQEVSEAADVFRQAYANVGEKHEAYSL